MPYISKDRTRALTVQHLISEFESLVPFTAKDRKAGKQEPGTSRKLKGWKAIAADVSRELMLNYPDDNGDGFYRGAVRESERIRADLAKFDKDLLRDPANYGAVKTIVGHFNTALLEFFSVFKQMSNDEYRQRVSQRSADDSRISVNIAPYLSRARDVLRLAAKNADTKDLKWEDVSCALALVTGRRMAEIHYSARFEQTDTTLGNLDCVAFTGQLKGKSRTVPAKGRLSDGQSRTSRDTVAGDKLIDAQFNIPVLVEPSLVIAGLQWLQSNGKRNVETAEQVNRKYSKCVSARIKSHWLVVKDDQWQTDETMTYHMMRGLYFISCLSLLSENRSFSSIKRLAPEILGDSDLSVVESYERFDIELEPLKELFSNN